MDADAALVLQRPEIWRRFAVVRRVLVRRRDSEERRLAEGAPEEHHRQRELRRNGILQTCASRCGPVADTVVHLRRATGPDAALRAIPLRHVARIADRLRLPQAADRNSLRR